jgi:hypothetical protein
MRGGHSATSITGVVELEETWTGTSRRPRVEDSSPTYRVGSPADARKGLMCQDRRDEGVGEVKRSSQSLRFYASRSLRN